MEIIFQSMSGLAYIHKNRIIHRNIKPSNLYLTDEKAIKIGNFCLSANKKKKEKVDQNLIVITEISRKKQKNESPLNISREIINDIPYNYNVDVYSMGCIFYEMCFLQHLKLNLRCN